ncbi:sugar transferase [Paenibacillus mucilaginosus]|uniref:Multidrug MFS transporter n=2 Tax=Paenibacillus mucilaginosus TaxID=61624 RepID=I0BC43_9BACL|nr:sugar transferase [Paenibacillus mucilaginosus]AEI39533.1 undecaprenyl-phosphate galactose phosphotransferase [Paenibacillus mucilaginosus KNP414]AFH59940.1 multidrug MFS transporter [Paenibacillus mucilaginosus K02]MCG7214649.1 sugar transferase [Paenibacillus mucilaginosus]WDM28490.1 sugar transferase [Paenibacillus mucilaginosus]
MHKFNKSSYVHLEMLFFDIIGLILSFVMSYFITNAVTLLHPMESYVWLLVIYVPIFFFSMSLSNMYHKLTFNYYDRIVRNVFKASFLSALFVAAMIFYTNDELEYSRMFYSIFMLSAFVITVVQRIAVYRSKGSAVMNGVKKTIIIGVPSVIHKFEYFITKTNVKMDLAGYIQVESDEEELAAPTLGRLDELEEILKRHVVDEVIFAVGDQHIAKVEHAVALCEDMGITTRLVLNIYNLNISKTHFTAVGTLPMLTLHTVSLNVVELMMKRTLDILGALVGLLITGLASLIIIPLIKLDSPGPVLFAQDRVGVNGRVFKIYKFRSMYLDAEERKKELMKQNKVQGGFMFKMDDDPRITPIGRFLRKTSLDELPQFLNILKGEMSLVGTRPPTVDEVSRYKTHHYRRISIKPGLTGMWQIKGRSEVTNFDQVVQLDTAYIDQWSVWLDIKIIFRTVIVVLTSKGAY